jgi:hypothetical protein
MWKRVLLNLVQPITGPKKLTEGKLMICGFNLTFEQIHFAREHVDKQE